MVFFFIFALLAGVGGAGRLVASASSDESEATNAKAVSWVAFTAAIAWTFPLNTVRILPTGVVAAPTSFGVVNTTSLKRPGINLKWPHESLTEVTVTPQQWKRNADSNDRNEDAGSIFVEGVALTTDATCQYQVNPQRVGVILANRLNVTSFVTSACSTALREAGVLKNPDGSSILNKDGAPVDMTLADALGGKRETLALNATYAFKRSLREQLRAASVPEDTVKGNLIVIGETLPPKAVQDAIAQRQARKEEAAASELLVQIEQNKGKSLSAALRAYYADLKGVNPDQVGAIPTQIGLTLQGLFNQREMIRSGNTKWGFVYGDNPGISIQAD
jgi:regulator of protease activity HflC (stomatin/prohibitin superfamily)